MSSPRQLEVSIAVYELQNMTKAAERLNMSQPAVSQAIKEIEEEYSIKLFDRHSSKILVTETGEKLYLYAKKILNLYYGFEKSLNKNEKS